MLYGKSALGAGEGDCTGLWVYVKGILGKSSALAYNAWAWKVARSVLHPGNSSSKSVRARQSLSLAQAPPLRWKAGEDLASS
jgi:hypothetical protein